MDRRWKLAFQIVVPLFIAAFCMFVLYGKIVESPYVVKYSADLEESRETVVRLTASSAASSAAITVLPGDVATPIASELAELSKGFLIVLGAIYLEKFLITVSGTLAFRWIIPIACLCYIVGVLIKKDILESLAKRLAVFAVSLILVIPVSLEISNMVEDTYKDSIEQVITSAENSSQQIQESVGADRNEEEAGNGLGKVVKSLQNAGDLIANGTDQLITYFERLLSRFVESIAILIVINCVIPILVILFFVWLLKIMFNFDAYRNYKNIERIMKKPEGGHVIDRE